MGRPNTRAQAAITRRANQSTGKGKASAKGPGKGKAIAKGSSSNAFSQVVDMPSVFQEQQTQQSSTEDSEGSGLEEDHREPQVAQPVAEGNAAAVEVQGGKRKAKKNHTSAKKKRSKQSETEDESGTSSSDSDSEGPMDGYSVLGEGNHGIPLWAHERRANSHRKTFNGVLDWKDGALVEDVKVATNQSTDFILGNHLSQRKRNKILNGDYVDMFTLLPPAKLLGEHTALTYDENFRRNASLLPSTRWDLTDPNYWGEDVNPYIEKKNLGFAKAGKTEAKRRRLCWEFNRGVCARPSCKYLHECDRCWGNHPASACFKNKQQPFRGGRGYFHNANRGALGSSHQGSGNRQ
ncbi:XP_028590673.1uncharacterized protein LOC114599482 [Podarcis lilfordi]|uniref:XP_028590673.1uncharacterized protein LOC114599482 n=1 Tax=Podarcis lilfordi TaxID=74358 RepID=A0AA35P593_9SAUR|nr:XP_028590673.1uncharacterized protein LOC114599482 [Podarcis lilfordi]